MSKLSHNKQLVQEHFNTAHNRIESLSQIYAIFRRNEEKKYKNGRNNFKRLKFKFSAHLARFI